MQFKPRLKIYQGSNRKNTFDLQTFEGRSYNHWCYVKKIKGQVVFNDYRYSVTTSKHQSEMRHFLQNELKIKNIVFVNQSGTLTDGIDLSFHYEKLYLAEYRLKSKGRKAQFYKDQKDIIVEMKKAIATLRKLGAKFKHYRAKDNLNNFKKIIVEQETSRLAHSKLVSQQQRAKRKQVEQTFKVELNSVDAVSI